MAANLCLFFMYMNFLGMFACYGKLGGKAAKIYLFFHLYEFESLPMYLTRS